MPPPVRASATRSAPHNTAAGCNLLAEAAGLSPGVDVDIDGERARVRHHGCAILFWSLRGQRESLKFRFTWFSSLVREFSVPLNDKDAYRRAKRSARAAFVVFVGHLGWASRRTFVWRVAPTRHDSTSRELGSACWRLAQQALKWQVGGGAGVGAAVMGAGMRGGAEARCRPAAATKTPQTRSSRRWRAHVFELAAPLCFLAASQCLSWLPPHAAACAPRCMHARAASCAARPRGVEVFPVGFGAPSLV